MDKQKVDHGTEMDKVLFKKCIQCIRCPVCDNTFRRPKLLPCNHDICQVCLNQHIIRTVPMSGYDIYKYTSDDAPQIKPERTTFVCPVSDCETEIRPRNPTKPTFEWAGQFENNLKLLSVLNLCSDRCSQRPTTCDNCHNLSWNVQAKCVCFTCSEKMCLKCEIVHKELYSDHAVCDISTLDVFSKEVISSWEGFAVKNSEAEQNQSDPFKVCKIHKPCQVNMICLNCLEEGCETCCAKRHSDCQEKTKVNKLGETLNFDNVATLTRAKFDTCHEKCLNRLAEFVSLLETLKMGPCKMKPDACDKNANEDNNYLHSRLTLHSEVHEPLDELVHQLSCQISRCEYLTQKVKENLLVLSTHGSKDASSSYSICQVLKCQNISVEIDGQINETEQAVVEMRKMVKGYFQNSAQFSEINRNEQDKLRCAVFELAMPLNKERVIPDESESVHFLKMLNVKNCSDMSNCWLTDCTFVNEQGIVAADNANMKLKLVSLEGTLQEFILDGKPWGVSSDDLNMVYVTLPDLCIIRVFQIGNSGNGWTGLRPTTAFRTKSKCYGISVVDSNIVVSLRNGSNDSLMVLTKQGLELKEISLQVCVTTKYIDATIQEDNIRVVLSSYSSNELLQVNIKQCDLQNDVASEQDSKLFCGYPTGVAIDGNGNVLFCCNNTGAIRCFYDSEEAKETILIRELSLPRALCFSKQLHQIVVTVDSGNKQNSLLVYAVK